CSMLTPPPSVRSIRFPNTTILLEYPPHTPCWWLPFSAFAIAQLSRENVASIAFATAYEKSFLHHTFRSLPPAPISPFLNAFPSTVSNPANKNTPSPPCVALFSANTFSQHLSNINIPAESCPLQYTA